MYNKKPLVTFHKNFVFSLRKISKEAPNSQLVPWCYPLTIKISLISQLHKIDIFPGKVLLDRFFHFIGRTI